MLRPLMYCRLPQKSYNLYHLLCTVHCRTPMVPFDMGLSLVLRPINVATFLRESGASLENDKPS